MSRRKIHTVRSVKRSQRSRPKSTVKNVPEPKRLTQAEVLMSVIKNSADPVSGPANDNLRRQRRTEIEHDE